MENTVIEINGKKYKLVHGDNAEEAVCCKCDLIDTPMCSYKEAIICMDEAETYFKEVKE